MPVTFRFVADTRKVCGVIWGDEREHGDGNRRRNESVWALLGRGYVTPSRANIGDPRSRRQVARDGVTGHLLRE